jgi:ubiquitin-protein ligase
MQSYLSETTKIQNNKLFYILKKKIYSNIESDSISWGIGNKLIYTIYHNLIYKPEFIVVEDKNNYDSMDNSEESISFQNFKICEEINLNIDDYDSIEDIIYDIEKRNNELTKKTNKLKNMFNSKNLDKFKLLLEEKKKELFENEKNKDLMENNKVNKSNNCNLFSKRACIEMLGDQVLKIFMCKGYDVDIAKFPNIQIFMSNFSFKGSDNLIVTINMDLDLNVFSNPPKIDLSSNKILKDNILKIICGLKPFSDINSWSVKYSIYDSVVNIYNMINTYGETNLEFASELERLINDLEYLLSIRTQNISEEKLLKIFDRDFVKENLQNKINKTNKTNEKWKKGTGYGHDGQNKWDIDSYIKCINEKKNNIYKMFNTFIAKLSESYSEFDKFENKNIIGQIIKLLINYLQNEEVSSSNAIIISDIIFNNLNILNTNTEFNKLLDLIRNYCEDNSITHKLFNDSKISKIISSNIKTSSDPFVNMFDEHWYVMYPNQFKTFYHIDISNITSEKILKLKKELNIIKKSISINTEASIFFWIEKNNLSKMKFIITGPTNTPYDHGLYIFDMTLSNEYPAKPPLVHFSNHGGVRFNPNLYNCGKVCLSLLGTWKGQKGESWNPETSSFFQILVSIQSQILIEEPYFNEPGYESYIGKAHGIANSKSYNDNIRKYNLDYAMNGLIEGVINNNSSYPEFDYIIRNYFKFKKDRIIGILDKWESEYTDSKQKNNFKISKEKFIMLTNNL